LEEALESSPRRELPMELSYREVYRMNPQEARRRLVETYWETGSLSETARRWGTSRQVVCKWVRRFLEEGEAAFADRKKRGPRPKLTEEDRRYLERWVEEAQPWEYGWVRSRWSCRLLMLQLLRERGVLVSRETVRRALHRLGFVWRRVRPVPPPPDPAEKRRRLRAILELLQERARGEGSFFQDETKLELNPRVGFAWMRKGRQRELPTPGTNRKLWISGVLHAGTGRLHWVVGPQKSSGLFLELLGELRSRYQCYRRLHLILDNDGSHWSRRVQEYLDGCGGGFGCTSCLYAVRRPTRWRGVWWGLHEAISCNHRCPKLEELWEWAEVT